MKFNTQGLWALRRVMLMQLEHGCCKVGLQHILR